MPCVLKVSWLIVDGLHVPEEEDGVIRSLASCWTCTSRAPLQASAQTELLCSWIPHGPPSCKQGGHSQLSQSSTAQSVKQKQARAHVKPNPNPLMLTLCFFFFFIQLFPALVWYPTCLAAGMSHFGHSPRSLWALYFLHTHTCTQTLNLTHQQQVFHDQGQPISSAGSSWQPPFPQYHRDYSQSADYIIPNSFICKSD